MNKFVFVTFLMLSAQTSRAENEGCRDFDYAEARVHDLYEFVELKLKDDAVHVPVEALLSSWTGLNPDPNLTRLQGCQDNYIRTLETVCRESWNRVSDDLASIGAWLKVVSECDSENRSQILRWRRDVLLRLRQTTADFMRAERETYVGSEKTKAEQKFLDSVELDRKKGQCKFINRRRVKLREQLGCSS